MSDSARPIGEIIAPLIVAAVGVARLQEFLGTFPTPAERKGWIMTWWEDGTISDAEAEMLIQVYQLETA